VTSVPISAIDVAIVAAFLAYCIASGLRSRKVSSRNLEEYFLAGRTLPGWKAGISMAATQFAADTPLLVTGMIATAGIFSLWRLWIYAVAFLLMGFVLGAAWRRAGVLTDAELAELRYGTRLAPVLRIAKAVYFGTIFNCTVLAMVLFAAARISEPFLRWSDWLPPYAFQAVVDFVSWVGVPLTAGGDPAHWAEHTASNFLSLFAVVSVTALYSTTGGLRAVVETDVVQFGIAMVATAVYAFVVIDMVGGLAKLPGELASLYGSSWTMETLAFTPTRARDAGWVVFGMIAIQWIAQMNADGTGYLAQRTMACRSDRDARNAAIVFTVAQVLARSLLWIAIGLGLLVLIPLHGAGVAAREATFVDGIEQYLPAGARGMMLTGMLAALASTVDTHLNWGASYWTNDIYRRLICDAWLRRQPTGGTLVWVARLSNLLILGIAVLILTRLDSIQSAWKVSLLLGAGMGGPLVLRWIWWRVTAASELAAIAASSVLAPLLLWAIDDDGARMLLMAGLATAVAIAVALLGEQEPKERLRVFYERVRPPGFWGPIARECGDDPRLGADALRRGLTATVTSSLAIFCALVGSGTLLFGSPPPTWFPWRVPWSSVLLLASAGLVAWAWSVVRGAPLDARSPEA
jgi:SSS family solute:Na+ symporter